MIGPLRTGDAVWNWENGLIVVVNCFLPTSQLVSSAIDYFLILAEVLSYQTKAYLLFTNSPRNRESPCGTEKINGLPDIRGGDRRKEGGGEEILSIRFDESKESLYTPRGMLHDCGLRRF